MFTQVRLELEERKGELKRKKINTAGLLAKWWSGHLKGIRAKLYKGAVEYAENEEPVSINVHRQFSS